MTEIKIVINNVPEYANEFEYIVCRENDNKYWFWGAFDDVKRASEVAKEIDGLVVETRKINVQH